MKKNICFNNKCIKCCKKTSMPLTKNDIEKIKNLGYKEEFFVKKGKIYHQLKNKDGKCVFHNGKTCQIYENRPEGCSIYPLIYDMDLKGAIIDNDCPYCENFKFDKNEIKTLFRLISEIKF